MILMLVIIPLPGETEVRFDPDAACKIIHRGEVRGKLIAAEVVSISSPVWGEKRKHFTAFDLLTTPPT